MAQRTQGSAGDMRRGLGAENGAVDLVHQAQALCRAPQRRLRPLALGHIRQQPDFALFGGIANELYPALDAILAAQRHHARRGKALAAVVLVVLAHPGAVRAIERIEPAVEGVKLTARIAGHDFGGMVEEQMIALHVHRPDGQVLDHVPQPLLAVAQGVLGAHPLGDIQGNPA